MIYPKTLFWLLAPSVISRSMQTQGTRNTRNQGIRATAFHQPLGKNQDEGLGFRCYGFRFRVLGFRD